MRRPARNFNSVIRAAARPVQEFLKLQSASGILLFAFAVAALVWSNSPWSETYDRLWHIPLTIGIGDAVSSGSLLHWINDGLMTVFFFVVGLEIKREILIGELSSLKKALLPVVAALGGMILPALIYVAVTAGSDAVSGWGIAMATDIAFSLGVLTLLGSRIPMQLKVFLTAFAIVDDIGAVLVIALFYASAIIWSHLLLAAILLVLLMVANIAGARHPLVYAVLGVGVWLAFLESGIHPTVAGVLVAMTIPARSRLNRAALLARSRSILDHLENEDAEEGGDQHASVRALGEVCEDVESPVQRFEHALHPWVIFLVMPVFALANAGVRFDQPVGPLLTNPVALGVIAGLVLGKQLGITLFSWLAVKAGIASLPGSVSWRHIYGVAWLGGIGFTMSLFIAGLAFAAGPLTDISKVGIYTASVIAGIGGLWILKGARVVVEKKNS